MKECHPDFSEDDEEMDESTQFCIMLNEIYEVRPAQERAPHAIGNHTPRTEVSASCSSIVGRAKHRPAHTMGKCLLNVMPCRS